MATAHDHRLPHQVQVHITQKHRYDPAAGAGVGDKPTLGLRPPQAPSKEKVLAVAALLPVGAALLGLAGATLTGTLILLAIAAPLFVIFSPVLVPAVLTVALAVAGVLTSGACGVTGLRSLSVLAQTLKRATGPQQMDTTKRYMQDLVAYTGEKTKEVGQTIQDKAQYIGPEGGPYDRPAQHETHTTQHRGYDRDIGPSNNKVLAVVGLLPVGGILLGLAGITLVGTMIGLAVVSPLFAIFSPVLVPAVLTIGLAIVGFLASGTFGLTGLSSLSFLVGIFRQATQPEQIDMAKRQVQDLVAYTGQKTKEVGQTIQEKAHEIGPDESSGTRVAHTTHLRHDRFDRQSDMTLQAPSKEKVLAVVTLLPVGGGLLGLAGVTLVGTLIGLAVITPLFVIFSPVLVPAVLTVGLALVGFMTSGAFGVTGLSSLSFLVNAIMQVTRTVPNKLQDLVEYTGQKTKEVGETMKYTGQKTKEMGQTIQDKAHEIGPEAVGGQVEVQAKAHVQAGGKEARAGKA